jgi:hypothetical protein
MLPEQIKPEDFKYGRPSIAELLECMGPLESLLKAFSERAGIARDAFTFNMAAILEILVRLDQRRDYYHYFHSTSDKVTEMSQTKKLALLCYWIVKYKPFVQSRAKAEACYSNYRCTINELIALFILKIDIASMPDVDYDKAMRVLYDSEMEKTLLHTFMHTDVTKEAVIQLFFSLEMALKK